MDLTPCSELDFFWVSLGEMLEGDVRDAALLVRLEKARHQYPAGHVDWLPGPMARYLEESS